MERARKPYVQVIIGDVDTVIHDAEGLYDAESYDRYATFEQARDAALSCIEDVLEEGDYDGDRHRDALEAMHRLLSGARTFEDVEAQTEYRRLVAARPAAA